MNLRLRVTLALFPLVLTGCSLFDGSEPQPSATAPPLNEPPPLGTPQPTPLPPQPGSTVSITWRQQTPRPHETEVDRPFQELVQTNAASGDDLWQAYTVEGNSPPRLERQTRRWLLGVSWLDGSNALLLSYATRYNDPDEWIRGAEKVSPGTPHALWDLRLPGSAHAVSPTGEYVFVYNNESALLLRADGTLWQPLADHPLDAAAWSPDGRHFVLSQREPTQTSPDDVRNYVLEPLGQEATLAGEGSIRGWSPDSSRLSSVSALIGDAEVSTFDVASSKTDAFSINGSESANYPFGWSQDGRYIIVRDGLIDLQSQRVLLQPTARNVIDAEVSPDGRWLLVTTEIQQQGARCEAAQPANKTLLIEIATGVERVLFDCNRFWADIEWVDAGHFLAYTHTCWGCEGKSRLFLVSIDGTAQQLTDEFRAWLTHDISPDGSKILVSGDELRVYTTTGVLLRSIPVEEGYTVTDVVWSPDGNSFAYIVGPTDFVVI